MTARLKSALLAASFLGLLTGAAAAAAATVVTTSNLRAGPGTEYPIQVTIPGGANVDVEGCDGNWCVARYAGYEGYIAQSLVAGGGAPGPAIAVIPDDDYYEEGPYYGYGYYSGGDYRLHGRRDWQNNNRRGNWQGRHDQQQGTRGTLQGRRDGQLGNRGNWQRNSGQSGVGVQQRGQQNFRATTPRVHSQPAAGNRGAGGGRAAAQGQTGKLHQ